MTRYSVKELLESSKKAGLDVSKTASKKVVYKTVEATGELIKKSLRK